MSVREIEIRIRTTGGHEHELRLPEDSTELRDLFTAFANRSPTAAATGPLVQLPLEGGTTACTIAVDHIVSIITSPPVLVQLESAPAPQPVAEFPEVRRPGCVVIDDFLGVDEHQDMLAFAFRERNRFEPGTVDGRVHPGRRNWVILNFGDLAHATLIMNRLLVWFPLLANALNTPVFPIGRAEAQLTAGNDGDFYGAHMDTDGKDGLDERVMACVYYFFREPKEFSGGNLRLYDTVEYGGQRRRAESFQEIEPVSNRLVVFTSTTFHELRPIHCPSKDFENSRFAVTSWLHRRGTPDPHATFGWGHFHCGQVASGFRARSARG